jgi:integrase
LDWDKKEFVFNSFKTAKNEGQVVIDVPEDLQEVLDIYISKHPLLKKGKLIKNTKIPFLVYDNSKPLDKINSITRILNKVLGRGVGSSMLRHSYLSNKYGDKLKEQQEDAKAMSHSIGQQKDYIKT